jgi:predicted O-methyltransferase YrrM
VRGSLAEAVVRQGQLTALPPRVAWFFVRARRLAARTGDEWSLTSATGPRALAHVLREARGARRVAEIGTGTAWTTAALALADAGRRIVSYDPIVRPERDRYMDLAGRRARARIELVDGPGDAGPAGDGERFEFVFIDASHERERTIATFQAWRPALAAGGTIAFHDWGNERYPGVTEAIRELGLEGTVHDDVFVWRPPASGAA